MHNCALRFRWTEDLTLDFEPGVILCCELVLILRLTDLEYLDGIGSALFFEHRGYRYVKLIVVEEGERALELSVLRVLYGG